MPFKTVTYDFKDESDVIYWIVKNNIGRRNLNAAQRAALVLQYKPVIAEKAKENEVKGGGDRKSEQAKSGCQNSDNPILKPVDTKKELAKLAGVSHDTVAKVEKVMKQAEPDVKDKMLSGEMSVNQAYANVRQAERKAEVAEKLETIGTKAVSRQIWRIVLYNSASQFLCPSLSEKIPIYRHKRGCCALKGRVKRGSRSAIEGHRSVGSGIIV